MLFPCGLVTIEALNVWEVSCATFVPARADKKIAPTT